MANQKEYKIIINGITESIEGISTLQDSLDRLGVKVEEQGSNIQKSSRSMDELAKAEQKIVEYNEEYQRALQADKAVLADKNKAIKESLDLEKANMTVQEGAQSTYAEKQQLLSALGKVIKNTNAETEEEIQKQNELKAQYAALNQELKDFDASLGNHQRNVGDYGQATKNLKQELREFQLEMANMLDNGVSKADPQFVELAKKAGSLKDAMSDAGEEINRFASDTKGLDDVINIAQSATAAFELYNGTMSAFGIETDGAEEAIQRLMGAMSIIQSLQTLSETLQNGSATARLFNTAMKVTGVQLVQNQMASIKATAAQQGLSTAQKAGAIASKTLGLAMKTIPLMLIIGLVTELVLHWKDIVDWFKKTFPVLDKMGGMMNTLKGVFVGFGKAIVHWVTNPLKTFANVIKKVLKGDFDGAVQEAINGLKNQFKGLGDAFNSGYKEQIEKGQEEIAKNNAAKQAEQTAYELEQLKARKGNQAKYSKEGVRLQNKLFAERKRAAKGNAEELKKIHLDELNFQRECEEQKAAAAKKSADARTRANRAAADAAKRAADEAAEAARIAEQKKKDYADSYERFIQATTASEKIALQTQLKLQKAKAKDLYDKGKWEEYKAELNEISKTELSLATVDNGPKLIAFWKSFSEYFKESNLELDKFKDGASKALEIAAKAGQENRELTDDEIDNIAKLYFNVNILNETQRNNFKAIIQSIFNEYELAVVKQIELEENKNKTIEEQDKKRYENAKNNAKKAFDNIKSLIKTTFGKGVENSPNLPSIYDRIFNKNKAKNAEDDYKEYWQNILDQTKSEIAKAEEQWDIYIFNVEKLYTKDSKEYRDAVDEKKKALGELIDLQKKAATGASGGPVSTDEKKRFKNPSPINKNESKTKYDDKDGGFGLDPTNWDALWDNDGPVWENLAKLADLMFENVLDPIAEGFSALLDFEIEEAQEALDKATEMHDKSVDKLEESQNKVQELNDKMKNSSGAQLEALKQQQADEMLLLAQREAEEKRLAREKEKREKELAKKEKQQRKLELKMQLIEGIVNTAVSVTKALTWGWPLGAIFAGIIGAMGAMQTAIIRKQMSKLADGGVLGGKSHAQGGVKIPSLGVEVEKGEAVINKRSTAKYLPLLDAINAEGNGGKHTLMKTKHNVYGISKFASGGVLNYQRIDDNFKQLDGTKTVERAIQSIDMHPQVSVVDINRGQKNLTQVRQMAGASR